MRNNTWGWVGIIVVVVLIIGGIFWWMNAGSTGTQTGQMATTTDMTGTTGTTASGVDTSGTNTTEAPVVVNNKNNTKSVAEIVAGLPNASTYADYLNSSGASISGKGPYTIFVSTDAGYALLKPGTITNMTAAQKKRMAQYSIVARMLDVNAQDSGSVKALSGDLLNFNVGSTNLVQVNSSYALAAYKGTNGIVYVINQPLVPPTSGNIMTP